MADYGVKNSTQRGEWYSKVVGPLCQAGKDAGFPVCGISKDAWLKEPAAGEAGSNLAAGKWPATLRNRAKLIADAYGLDFVKDVTLATLGKASVFAAEAKLAILEGGVADTADAADGGLDTFDTADEGDLYDTFADGEGGDEGNEGAGAPAPGLGGCCGEGSRSLRSRVCCWRSWVSGAGVPARRSPARSLWARAPSDR